MYLFTKRVQKEVNGTAFGRLDAKFHCPARRRAAPPGPAWHIVCCKSGKPPYFKEAGRATTAGLSATDARCIQRGGA